jgi:thiamine pyrophosphate-dependent acetolactate synthase large subunit-like protein
MATALDAASTALTGAVVRACSTVPGESSTPLIDAVDRPPDLRLPSTRQESIAALVAEARAKLTSMPQS